MRAVHWAIAAASARLWQARAIAGPDGRICGRDRRAAKLAGMTDVAASDFRHPRRYVRLDTILRLRWLAVLGQLAAIFIVVQGLEFDVEVVPCVTIIGLSALLNLVLQIAFNPMQRLEPVYAAALLALNIVELAGLLFFTGGLQNPFSFLFLAPVLISATALPIRLTIALGVLAVACASRAGLLPSAAAMGQRRSAGAAADLSVRRLALDRGRDRRHQPLCVPGHRGSPQALGRAGRDRTGAGARTASDPARRPCRRRRPRTRHAAVDDLPDFARTGAGPSQDNSPLAGDLKTLREQAQRCRDILAKITQLSSTGAPFDRMPLSTLIEETVAPHRDFGVAIKVRIAVAGTPRAGRHPQSGDPLWRRQHPGKRRRFRARRRWR